MADQSNDLESYAAAWDSGAQRSAPSPPAAHLPHEVPRRVSAPTDSSGRHGAPSRPPAPDRPVGNPALGWPDEHVGAQGVQNEAAVLQPGVQTKPVRRYSPNRRKYSRRVLVLGIGAVFLLIFGLLALGVIGLTNDQAGTDTAVSDAAPASERSEPGTAAPRKSESGDYEVVERDDNSVELLFSSDVLFDVGSAELTDNARSTLDEIVSRLGTEANGTIRVEGHTDSESSEQFNLELSQGRARSVKQYLAFAGITLPIEARGLGETQPVAPNDNADGSPNEEGRTQNRRVTIVYDR